MKRKILKNKPLVEAIFELRWELEEYSEKDRGFNEIKDARGVDPHYQLLVGRLYDRISKDYPFYEKLPAAKIPEEIAGYIVQHRYRKKENRWPLIQIGPGILTVNDTEGYIWEDFQKRIEQIIRELFSLYPNPRQNLIIKRLMLRYVDSVKFDFDNNDIFLFLKEKLKTDINLYKKLFQNTKVEPIPSNFDLRFEFNSSEPEGQIFLRFGRGKKDNENVLLWETLVKIENNNIPNNPKDISKWINKAHNLTDDWFFKLIEGELERRFE
jgi:uncharacterized protein (TIGR04255 family)